MATSMRIRIHFEDTDGQRVGMWETTDKVFDMHLGEHVSVSGKRFQVVNSRTPRVGEKGIGSFDRIAIVFPD